MSVLNETEFYLGTQLLKDLVVVRKQNLSNNKIIKSIHVSVITHKQWV